jgi:hypothetical protein
VSHRTAEAKSLALHRAVAKLVRADFTVVERARQRVEAWRASRSVHPHYVDAWLAVLALPLDEVAAFLVDESERARELRQVSPFAGILDPRTRWKILRDEAVR